MAQEVEVTTLDLRYESYRMRNAARERQLLGSIAERGIEEPLEGVDSPSGRVLLNGFKRLRCARKLGLATVPYNSLGEDNVVGIVNLLRVSNNRSLSILEQAGFLDELQRMQQMSVAELAEELSRSKSWVSMRLGLLSSMSRRVREKLFREAFPVYSYMYTLRPFMRMNGVKPQEIEAFIEGVSGKKLSVREIELLAHGYFRGPESFRQEIRRGNVALPLERVKQIPQDEQGCSQFERVMLKDLEITHKYMQRVTGKSADERLKSRPFCAQANLLTAGILSRAAAFVESLRQLYDRSAKA